MCEFIKMLAHFGTQTIYILQECVSKVLFLYSLDIDSVIIIRVCIVIPINRICV